MPRYVSIYVMNLAPQRSASITAAATLAITGSCIALLAWAWFLYHLVETLKVIHDRGLVLKTWEIIFIGAVAIFPPALGILGLQTGSGLFRLESWARKSALLWAAGSSLLCAYLLATHAHQILIIDSQHWSSEITSLKQFLTQALLIALAPVGVWWLVLFTRPSVKAQFLTTPSDVSSDI
jgi:hypothetical protein